MSSNHRTNSSTNTPPAEAQPSALAPLIEGIPSQWMHNGEQVIWMDRPGITALVRDILLWWIGISLPLWAILSTLSPMRTHDQYLAIALAGLGITGWRLFLWLNQLYVLTTLRVMRLSHGHPLSSLYLREVHNIEVLRQLSSSWTRLGRLRIHGSAIMDLDDVARAHQVAQLIDQAVKNSQ